MISEVGGEIVTTVEQAATPNNFSKAHAKPLHLTVTSQVCESVENWVSSSSDNLCILTGNIAPTEAKLRLLSICCSFRGIKAK